jgi:hypothetical protein
MSYRPPNSAEVPDVRIHQHTAGGFGTADRCGRAKSFGTSCGGVGESVAVTRYNKINIVLRHPQKRDVEIVSI